MTVCSFFYQGEHFDVTGGGYHVNGAIRAVNQASSVSNLDPLLVPLVACNDSRVTDGKVIGDPMEAALLILAQKGGVVPSEVVSTLPRITEIPFDAEHKFMATFHRADGHIQLFVKGAHDVLLNTCEYMLNQDVACVLDPPAMQQIELEYTALAEQGLRGLLIASRTIPESEFDASGNLFRWIEGLTFIGLIGLVDPLRPEAKVAISECMQAGIAIKMITGDHPLTAQTIARELGLEGKLISGAELDRMDSDQLAEVINDVTIFARVTPTNKVTIVRALQKKGHVVAMTGDGVNDAPALKSADIGVAMGTGTAVAKEAAMMVLLDDNFATLVRAVYQGRTLYDNILKFVRFQLSTTIGAILTVFFAPLAGLPEPFTAVQILWVAIIMDGPPAISLALDAARPGVMLEKPRNQTEQLLPFARLGKIVTYGITMMVGTLGALHYGLLHAGMGQVSQTFGFTTFVLFQFFNVFNARVENGTAFNKNIFMNKMLWISLACVLLLQAVAVHWPPAQTVFGTEAMNARQWGMSIAIAASILFLEEGRKLIVALFGYVSLRILNR